MVDDLKLVADQLYMLAEMQLDTPTRGMWILLLHSANTYEQDLDAILPMVPPGATEMRLAIEAVKALPRVEHEDE